MNIQGNEGVPGVDQCIQVTPQERHQMISVAAYYCAERRAFAPGGEQRDWLEAESEIDRMLTRMARDGVTRRRYEDVGLRNALRFWAGQ